MKQIANKNKKRDERKTENRKGGSMIALRGNSHEDIPYKQTIRQDRIYWCWEYGFCFDQLISGEGAQRHNCQ